MAHEYGWTLEYISGLSFQQILILRRQITRRHYNRLSDEAFFVHGRELPSWDEVQAKSAQADRARDSELNAPQDKAISEHLELVLAKKQAEIAGRNGTSRS